MPLAAEVPERGSGASDIQGGRGAAWVVTEPIDVLPCKSPPHGHVRAATSNASGPSLPSSLHRRMVNSSQSCLLDRFVLYVVFSELAPRSINAE